MEMWAQIRHMHFNQRWSMRKIAKTLGINRRTVKRAIATQTPPSYQRKVSHQSILDPFKDEIRQLVRDANGEIMATVIYEHLSQREDTPQAPKYCGSYVSLARYVRQIKAQNQPREAFLRIEPPPGYDAQCDWGAVDLEIRGRRRRLAMFVLKLSYSRFRFATLFACERQECFFDGHLQAFRYFEGVPKQVTYDNLKTAVLEVLKGKNRIEQEAFAKFRGQFPFAANFAAPAKSNEKGKVENDIKYLRAHAFGICRSFESLEAANAHLRGFLQKDAQRVHSTHKQRIVDRYHQEKPYLSPLPFPLPEACRIVTAKVNKFSFIQFETNRYSVPTEYVYQTVTIKAFPQRLQIVSNERVIATHSRRFSRHGEQIDPYHFLSLLEKKARAVDHAVVLQAFDLDPIIYRLKTALNETVANPNREWIRILRLTEQYEMSRVVEAIKIAFARHAVSFSSIANLLRQQVNPQPVVERGNCLVNCPQLATVVVRPRPLSGYDALLCGGATHGR